MRFTTVPAVPSPIVPHAHYSGVLCDGCAGNVRVAAEAIVANVLTSLDHAPGHGRCTAPAARASGWGLVVRVASFGPAALLVAYDHLASLIEAGACAHRRNDLGAPDLTLIMRPAAVLASELAAEIADGIGTLQRYMDHRSQTDPWARGAPLVAELAGLDLGRHAGSRLGLVVLVLAAAGAELGPRPPRADPFDGVVLTAEGIAEAAAGPDERPRS